MATGNWTRPDNIWCSSTPDDPIYRCDVVPVMCLPMANHLPIIMELSFLLPRAPKVHALNFRQAHWPKVNADLSQRLEELSPTVCISTEEEFFLKVDKVICITKETLEDHLKERRLSLVKWCWWTKELANFKKTQNRLSRKSYRFCHVQDHPAHAEYKAAANQFKIIMEETCNQDWTNWLDSATQQDLYMANKYITNKPSDYSCARVPTLKTTSNNASSMAEDNVAKARALANSFFPPPPTVSQVPSGIMYPSPLRDIDPQHHFNQML